MEKHRWVKVEDGTDGCDILPKADKAEEEESIRIEVDNEES